MASRKTQALALGAALFGGLLAGVTANRALVELPAWQRIGLVGWANFTRAENGSLLYIVVGFMALALTISTAISLAFDRSAKARRLPAYAAAILAITYGAITRGILVPAIFHLRASENNAAALEQIFGTVVRWSAVNDALHVLAFALTLWALAEVLSEPRKRPV
jgi:hypothetical protein